MGVFEGVEEKFITKHLQLIRNWQKYGILSMNYDKYNVINKDNQLK